MTAQGQRAGGEMPQVEGPSDLIVCTGLAQRFDMHLEAAGAQIVPVVGKGEFHAVAKLMTMIGKAPVVLADADAFADATDLVNLFGARTEAIAAATAKGHPDFVTFARTVHSHFCRTVDEKWDDIAPRATLHSYWTRRDESKDEREARRRAAFATLMAMAEAERRALPHGNDWDGLYGVLSSLLESVEAAGCFILRRGTIEDYYSEVPVAEAGKPEAATREVERLSTESVASVEARCSDILRALEFAASTPAIDEEAPLRDILLEMTGLLVGNLTEAMDQSRVDELARQAVGDQASLFKLRLEPREGEAPELVVELNSTILDVPALSIRLTRGCNPVAEVDRFRGGNRRGATTATERGCAAR